MCVLEVSGTELQTEAARVPVQHDEPRLYRVPGVDVGLYRVYGVYRVSRVIGLKLRVGLGAPHLEGETCRGYGALQDLATRLGVVLS